MSKKWEKGDKVICNMFPSIYGGEEAEVLDVEDEYIRVRFNLSKVHQGLDRQTVQTFKSYWFERSKIR